MSDMNLCEEIDTKLVTGDELSESEKAHLQSCTACRDLEVAIGRVARAGQELGEFGPVDEAEVAAVRAGVRARIRPVPVVKRLAFAGAAMAAGILGAVLILGTLGGPDVVQSGEALLALMDEVDEITTGSGESFELVTDLFALDYGSDLDEDETDLPLPGGYQVLNDVLEQRWM